MKFQPLILLFTVSLSSNPLTASAKSDSSSIKTQADFHPDQRAWAELKMDEYISTYPHGKTINFKVLEQRQNLVFEEPLTFVSAFCTIPRSTLTKLDTQDGIFGALRGGDIVALTPNQSALAIRQTATNFFRVRGVVMVLHSMNKCDDSGLNGAWHQADRLSYCGPDKMCIHKKRLISFLSYRQS
ncbi:hypothetical protein O181_040140 [Austropuccinia psidii MF-1]|uniref:DUF7872 domain-containing protein n=1 Tax=Austropuccinia psidii MF-1 TaxID=1389203 RepID=A0A9Q3HFU5_9BASI|nr:hypothetical protein [Austropuccinia psidii MF-1]